jgi:hypothetical protein
MLSELEPACWLIGGISIIETGLILAMSQLALPSNYWVLGLATFHFALSNLIILFILLKSSLVPKNVLNYSIYTVVILIALILILQLPSYLLFNWDPRTWSVVEQALFSGIALWWYMLTNRLASLSIIPEFAIFLGRVFGLIGMISALIYVCLYIAEDRYFIVNMMNPWLPLSDLIGIHPEFIRVNTYRILLLFDATSRAVLGYWMLRYGLKLRHALSV